ncbi:expressed protein, partial [Phakopsora pachyrhizi]
MYIIYFNNQYRCLKIIIITILFVFFCLSLFLSFFLFFLSIFLFFFSFFSFFFLFFFFFYS